MAERPALPFEKPILRPRIKGGGRRPNLHGPSPKDQAARLENSLKRLTDAFAGRRVRVGDEYFEREYVLVLEIAGDIEDFASAVRKIEGLEYLADEALDKVDPDDFWVEDEKGRKSNYKRQLFLILSDAQAWRQLLGLWTKFQQDKPFDFGLTRFKHLFSQLRDLRPWNDQDRLERTGAIEAWRADLSESDELVEFEIELWLTSDKKKRKAVVESLRAELEKSGGELVSEYFNSDINYHGLLGRLPSRLLLETARKVEVKWMTTTYVRFFHACGQMAAPQTLSQPETGTGIKTPEGRASGSPRMAVLDGLPLAAHNLLRGRITIDDPEGWGQTISVAHRQHGTGVLSAVIHGDLAGDSSPLSKPVYVRPILRVEAAWVSNPPEELPRDRLAVDTVHAAVARLFEGDEPAAPRVTVVLLAIGDSVQQYHNFVSPLARLLDWLAQKYRILFLVPAGNQLAPLKVPADIDLGDGEEIQHEILCDLLRTAPERKLLAPGESVNAVTVGAAHSDAHGDVPPDDRVDPFLTSDLASCISGLGGGVRRSVKPDILMDGGRYLVRIEPQDGEDGWLEVSFPLTDRAPGIRVASPGRSPGVLDQTVHSSSTSVATALAAHHAGKLIEQIERLRAEFGDAMPGPELDAVLVKAALAHGARWGHARELIQAAQQDLGDRKSRSGVARIVGYGRATAAPALRCSDDMVTLVGGGWLAEDEAHSYRFPLPPSLASRTDQRRLTLTLAWLTPINPRHRQYRRAALKLEPSKEFKTLGERTEADTYDACRGTLQHEVVEGRKATAYAPGTALELTVSCRGDAGKLDERVPYAILASLEVPVGVGIPVYQEVRQALRIPVSVRAGY